jgi:hypothetical protein
MSSSDSAQSSDAFEIGQGVIFQDIQGDIVILNIGTQQYYGLTAVGAHAWNMLMERCDLRTVASRIEADYQVDSDTALADLRLLTSELVDTGLLTPLPRVPIAGSIDTA